MYYARANTIKDEDNCTFLLKRLNLKLTEWIWVDAINAIEDSHKIRDSLLTIASLQGLTLALWPKILTIVYGLKGKGSEK